MGHWLASLSANSAALFPTSDERYTLFYRNKRRSFHSFSSYQFGFDALAVTATSILKIDIPNSRKSVRKLTAIPSNIDESCSSDAKADHEHEFIDSSQDFESKPLSADQVNYCLFYIVLAFISQNLQITAMLLDSERAKLLRKLSEANQQNRSLKRQLRSKEEALTSFKRKLSSLELEMQVLTKMAEEISQCGIPEGSRRINGKFIQSHIVSRLEALHQKLLEEVVQGVETALCKEVPVLWYGMAESVIVMGTFDEWCEGEHLSKYYDGLGNTFTGKLLLQPGRYEIKFLVDGEWHLSPEYPSVGEGSTKNNLLLVN